MCVCIYIYIYIYIERERDREREREKHYSKWLTWLWWLRNPPICLYAFWRSRKAGGAIESKVKSSRKGGGWGCWCKSHSKSEDLRNKQKCSMAEDESPNLGGNNTKQANRALLRLFILLRLSTNWRGLTFEADCSLQRAFLGMSGIIIWYYFKWWLKVSLLW